MKRTWKQTAGALALSAALLAGLTVPAAAAPFTDVSPRHWAANEIARSAEIGIFKGVGDGRFGVGESMSRSAFVTALARFFGWETAETASLPFDDVNPAAWYAPALAAALQHGAVTVQSDDFRPNEPITREEVSVLLVRALGYGTVAGLAQKLDLPFTDVTSNRGYIAMAYDFGIFKGVDDTRFGPRDIATREQCAVVLMRLHDKLGMESRALGQVSSGENLPDLTGFQVLAVDGGKLMNSAAPKLTGGLTAAEVETIREAAPQTALLKQVQLDAAFLTRMDVDQAAEVLSAAAEDFDGLFLDVPALRDGGVELNTLAALLRDALGEKALYIAVDAPCTEGHKTDYDYKTLGELSDRLVVRIHPHMEETGGMAVAPVEPVEEVYYGLRQVKREVPADKLVLSLSTAATEWTGTRETGALTGLEVEQLLEQEGVQSYYSQRYGCSYLIRGDVTVWYPDGKSTALRAELSRLFGVEELLLGDLSGASAKLLESI